MQHRIEEAPRMAEHISLRVPDGIMERGEKLAEALSSAPAYQGIGISRSRALTLALVRGLEELEKEHAVAKRRQKR